MVRPHIHFNHEHAELRKRRGKQPRRRLSRRRNAFVEESRRACGLLVVFGAYTKAEIGRPEETDFKPNSVRQLAVWSALRPLCAAAQLSARWMPFSASSARRSRSSSTANGCASAMRALASVPNKYRIKQS